jgi:hypothetical protein
MLFSQRTFLHRRQVPNHVAGFSSMPFGMDSLMTTTPHRGRSTEICHRVADGSTRSTSRSSGCGRKQGHLQVVPVHENAEDSPRLYRVEELLKDLDALFANSG